MSDEIERAIKLASGEYGAGLMRMISAVNWPIYIINKKSKKINNGTCFCVDTGEGFFLVTAYHVYQEYLDNLKFGVECYIGSCPFDMEGNFIKENQELSEIYDIAVFNFQKKAVKLIELDHDYYPINCWPPETVSEGDGILFAGYPGVERIEHSPFEVNSGIICGSAIAQRSPEQNSRAGKFVFDIDYSKLVDPLKLGISPVPGYNMAGVSGSAIFKMKFGPVTHWSLGGVFVQGTSGQFNLFTGVDLNCLTSKGYLLEPR